MKLICDVAHNFSHYDNTIWLVIQQAWEITDLSSNNKKLSKYFPHNFNKRINTGNSTKKF